MSDRARVLDRLRLRRPGEDTTAGQAAREPVVPEPAPGFGDVGSMLSDPRASAARPESMWLGDSLVLVGPDPGGLIAATVVDLPAEPGTVTVVGTLPDAAQSWGWLVDVAAEAAPPGGAARIVVSRAGAAVPGGQIPAWELARRLRLRVVAPDGEVVVAPGGATFVTGDGPAGGTWLTFTGDEPPQRHGPRHPVPVWGAVADRLTADEGRPSLLVTGIPAGVWIRTRPARGTPDDVPTMVPADPRLCTVVIGVPGGPQPAVEQVAGLLGDLADADRAVLLVGYGYGAEALLSTAAVLARRWAEPVIVATGTPVVDEHGAQRTAVLDEDGAPVWWPTGQRLAVPAEGLAEPVDPVPPVSGLDRIADGIFAVRDDWLVEITHFGLWVRPAESRADRTVPARIPWDPRWHSILAGVPGQPVDGMRAALAHLVARLDPVTRQRTRIVPADLLTDPPATAPDPIVTAGGLPNGTAPPE